MTQDTKTCNSA